MQSFEVQAIFAFFDIFFKGSFDSWNLCVWMGLDESFSYGLDRSEVNDRRRELGRDHAAEMSSVQLFSSEYGYVE